MVVVQHRCRRGDAQRAHRNRRPDKLPADCSTVERQGEPQGDVIDECDSERILRYRSDRQHHCSWKKARPRARAFDFAVRIGRSRSRRARVEIFLARVADSLHRHHLARRRFVHRASSD